MTPGSIVAFRDKRSVVLALVLKDEGKSLRIHSEKGKAFPYPRARLTLDLGGNHDTSGLGVRELLRETREKAEALRQEIDLPLLWETLRESSEEGLPLEELGELYFGEVSPLELFALLCSLEEDSAYFRRKQERIVAKDPEVVAETLRQQELAEEKERLRLEAMAWIRSRLKGSEDPPPDGARDLIDLIKQVAVQAEAAPDYSKAQEFLKGLGFDQRDGAFELLIQLGIFHPDENLSLHAYDVAQEFSPDALREADEIASRGPYFEEDRLDLTHLATTSIDDAETTEVDDALSLELLPDGAYKVWIHIADVSAFVPHGSPLAREAMARGTTFYLPDRTIPMFPEVLSMGLCSLKQGEERAALSVAVTLEEDGSIREVEHRATTILVDEAWTYEEAAEEIEDEEEGLLLDLHAISTRLRERREEDGAQSYCRQELRIKVDDDGQVQIKKIVGDSPGQVLVSELMILANRVTGKALAEAGLPALYKRQEAPDGSNPNFIPKSSMGLEPGDHYGLGISFYCQMTSPIRRYPDLAMHRQISAMIGRPVEPLGEDQLLEILALSQERDQASIQVQKEGKKYFLLKYLQNLSMREQVAQINHVKRGGLVGCRLEEFLLPCMLPVPQGKSLRDGDRVLVKIQDVRPRDGKIRLRFVEHLSTEVDKILAEC